MRPPRPSTKTTPVHLKEELGDVLLQVVFHARMAQEAGWFDFDDVVDGVAQKLVFRHPYVFGDGKAADADGALNAWESQKRREKDQRTTADALDAVAPLPARPDAGGEDPGKGPESGL